MFWSNRAALDRTHHQSLFLRIINNKIFFLNRTCLFIELAEVERKICEGSSIRHDKPEVLAWLISYLCVSLGHFLKQSPFSS